MAKDETTNTGEGEVPKNTIETVDSDSASSPDQQDPNAQLTAEVLAPFIAFLNPMRTRKRHITVAPTDTPKNFYDQIRYYDTGGVRRLYIYINGAWRYVVLT